MIHLIIIAEGSGDFYVTLGFFRLFAPIAMSGFITIRKRRGPLDCFVHKGYSTNQYHTMSQYYRNHPDEPISHDWYAGGRRVKPTTAITVTQIEGEPTRFWARSRSRPEMLHVVDLVYQENAEDKPYPKCSCEESFAKGNVCAHIGAVIQYLLDDKAQRIKDGLEEPERSEDDPRRER